MHVAADILLEIAAHVEHSDRISMSLVCRSWADAAIQAVRIRLVYLVRHSKHSLPLKEYLAKFGHLVRDLSIGDRRIFFEKHTSEDFIALRDWLNDNVDRIIRLRVLPGGNHYNVVATLDHLRAIPFRDQFHGERVVARCNDKVVSMLQDASDVHIYGWKYSYLGLHSPVSNSRERLWWSVTRIHVERISMINTNYRFGENDTWYVLKVAQQISPNGFQLAGHHDFIPGSVFPRMKRLGPARYGELSPTGLTQIPSKCSGELREMCLQKRGALSTMKRLTGLRPAVSMYDEIQQYCKVHKHLIGSSRSYSILDLRCMTLDKLVETQKTLWFYDIHAEKQPLLSLEYLQIIGNTEEVPHTPLQKTEDFMTVARLEAIPVRFPNLRYLLIENIPHFDDRVLSEILTESGNPRPRLRNLRHILVNNCSITKHGQKLLKSINTGSWLK